MRVLIACEFSGIVREAFKKQGHDAWSCDLEDTEIPGQHIKGDVLNILNENWDLMIAHPPCTYLTVTANKWLKDQPERKSGVLVGAARRQARQEAIDFIKKTRSNNSAFLVWTQGKQKNLLMVKKSPCFEAHKYC